jgi:hypothetical protein
MSATGRQLDWLPLPPEGGVKHPNAAACDRTSAEILPCERNGLSMIKGRAS